MSVIRTVVVCPQPPLLFRELAGRHDAAHEVRDACLAALRQALSPAPDVVVVVGGEAATAVRDGSLAPAPELFGGPHPSGGGPRAVGLPLSLGVGRRLLDEAGWQGPTRLQGVARGAALEEVEQVARSLAGADRTTVLLVLGDGSARRGVHAPGYVDERAFDYDEQTACALANGDVVALLERDVGLAEELMVSGRAALQVMAAAVRAQGTPVRAEISYRDDPFGVMYVVATWHLPG